MFICSKSIICDPSLNLACKGSDEELQHRDFHGDLARNIAAP